MGKYVSFTNLRNVFISALAVVLFACSSGGGSDNNAPGTPDWVIRIDTNASGTPLNTALLGHYDLSGTLFNYDTVSGLITNMQAIGFSEWRVSVGRWEIGTEMLPMLTDSTACPTDPQLTNSTATDLELINARSWFTNDVSPYNLDYVRGVIDMATTFGAKAFVSIDSMPFVLSANQVPNRTDCSTSFMNAVSNHWPADNDVFASAVTGMVQRIVEGSGVEPGRPVTHFEVWNEPEFPYFWHEGLAAHTTEFFDMASTTLVYLDAYRSGSTNPDIQALKFGLASFANASTAVAAIEGFDTAAVTIPMDFISFHSYHNNPRDIAADVQLVADALASSTHYQDLELVLAEWGSDLATTSGDTSYANSMQPPMLMASTIAMSAALGLDRAHHSIFYDFHPGVTLGLLNNNGQPKPLYRAYQLLSEAITSGSIMLLPNNTTNNQLTSNGEVLVTRDSGDTVRVLLINRDMVAHTARVENLAGTMSPVQIKLFDDYTMPISTSAPSGSEIQVPAESLVLLQF